jgi:tRNA (pseudouridine54-N1)-methyltransferase
MTGRAFLLIQNETRTDADFSARGAANNGRLDIGCRFLNAALFTSYSLRRDVDARLLFLGPPDPPVQLHFRGSDISGMHPDELSIAGYIKKNMKSFDKRRVPANNGVSIDKRDLGQIVDDTDRKPFLLHEDGTDIRDIEVPDDPLFILGDNRGIGDDQMHQLEERDVETVSVAPDSYQAQQVVSFLNIWMDRHEG